jgi:hypothetical protein
LKSAAAAAAGVWLMEGGWMWMTRVRRLHFTFLSLFLCWFVSFCVSFCSFYSLFVCNLEQKCFPLKQNKANTNKGKKERKKKEENKTTTYVY